MRPAHSCFGHSSSKHTVCLPRANTRKWAEGDYYGCVCRQNPNISPNSSLSFPDVQSDIKTQVSPPPLILPDALGLVLTFSTLLPAPVGATLCDELQPFPCPLPITVPLSRVFSPAWPLLVILQFSAERPIGRASRRRLCWHVLCQYFSFSGFCARPDRVLCEGRVGAASLLFAAVFPGTQQGPTKSL